MVEIVNGLKSGEIEVRRAGRYSLHSVHTKRDGYRSLQQGLLLEAIAAIARISLQRCCGSFWQHWLGLITVNTLITKFVRRISNFDGFRGSRNNPSTLCLKGHAI